MLNKLGKFIFAGFLAVCFTAALGGIPTGWAVSPHDVRAIPGNLAHAKVNGHGLAATCNKHATLTMGQNSLIGSLGDEFVSLVRQGRRVFGTHAKTPVRMQIIGSEDSGYWLMGDLGGEKVRWKVDGNWITGDLDRCPK